MRAAAVVHSCTSSLQPASRLHPSCCSGLPSGLTASSHATLGTRKSEATHGPWLRTGGQTRAQSRLLTQTQRCPRRPKQCRTPGAIEGRGDGEGGSRAGAAKDNEGEVHRCAHHPGTIKQLSKHVSGRSCCEQPLATPRPAGSAQRVRCEARWRVRQRLRQQLKPRLGQQPRHARRRRTSLSCAMS